MELIRQALQARTRQAAEKISCLYASNLTSSMLAQTFPGKFHFGGSGSEGWAKSDIVDPEIGDVLGSSAKIHLDMGGWAMLTGCAGDVLVAGGSGTAYAGRSLMVEVEVGDGVVFYTSFHNRAQASASERALLQLPVLKQTSAQSTRRWNKLRIRSASAWAR